MLFDGRLQIQPRRLKSCSCRAFAIQFDLTLCCSRCLQPPPPTRVAAGFINIATSGRRNIGRAAAVKTSSSSVVVVVVASVVFHADSPLLDFSGTLYSSLALPNSNSRTCRSRRQTRRSPPFSLQIIVDQIPYIVRLFHRQRLVFHQSHHNLQIQRVLFIPLCTDSSNCCTFRVGVIRGAILPSLAWFCRFMVVTLQLSASNASD